MPKEIEIARGVGRTALVADDDPAFRLLLNAALIRLGFEVTVVADGLSAVDRAIGRNFDLVMLDVMMPGADGFEVCEALRAMPAYRRTPILMLTGLEDHSSVGRAFEAGASDFERKPVHVNLLCHRVLFLIKAADDLTELEEKRAELEYRASHDALTGLSNRVGLAAHLGACISADAARNLSTALLYIDLDGFKGINDTFGHPFGDRLLCTIVDRLRSVLPGGCLLARVGGDEFVVVVDGLEDPDSASEVAGRILGSLDEVFRIDDNEFLIGASIGMCSHPEHGSLPSELLEKSDLAMYRAKELGRRRYQAYDERLSLEMLQRKMLQAGLRKALSDGELELVYQPLFDLSTGRIEAAEALLRWNHPVRGHLEAQAFLPLAEDAGLLPEIGQWVLENAARQAARWCRPPFGLAHLAINMSGAELRRGGLLARLRSTLERTGAEPWMLQFEVSEALTADLAGNEESFDALRALGALGLSFSIDDFGAGRSSVPSLERLPVSTLKVDITLVRSLPDSAHERAVVNAIIALGRSLNLTLIAEGIETREQMAWLREAGCALGQGHAFARPCKAEAFEALLTARQGGIPMPSETNAPGSAAPSEPGRPRA